MTAEIINLAEYKAKKYQASIKFIEDVLGPTPLHNVKLDELPELKSPIQEMLQKMDVELEESEKNYQNLLGEEEHKK